MGKRDERRAGSQQRPDIQELRIADILRDQEFQVRVGLDPDTVRRYAAVYASENEMPPVRVAKVNGAYVLVDGWHRIAALESLERATVDAEVIPATARHAHWLAARANLEHGLPLKSKELREVFRMYVKAREHRDSKRQLKSYRAIAQDLGGLKKHTTIRNWMKKDFPKIAQQYGASDDLITGGLRDIPERDVFEDAARDGLNTALAAFNGVADAMKRGDLIERAEEMLAKMKQAGNWEPSDF